MRFAGQPAIILVILAVALSWPIQVESTDAPVGDAATTVARLIPTEIPPFRCDSVFPKDCFEMFQRYSTRMDAVTTVAVAPPQEQLAPAANESIACALDVSHRGDRCIVRNGR